MTSVSEMKKYHDVVRLGHKSTVGVLNDGDHIVIQEKLDGANASFRRDGNSLRVECFSRNTKLDESNGLRGFYQWAQSSVDAHLLQPNWIYFGEWLVSHKVTYPSDAMNKFYLFDVYDTVSETYLPFDMVWRESQRLNLHLVPVFYIGPYRGFDHLQQFVGLSELGDVGEGIVVKNVAYLDRYGHQMYVKLISESFAEVQKQKLPKDPNQPTTPEQQFASTYVTLGRVNKLIHKLVDEGIVDAQPGMEDMGVILRNLHTSVYEDLLKEESDALPDGYDDKLLRKTIGRTLPTIVKRILTEEEVAV